MTQSNQSSNLLVKLLGSAALAGLVGVVALGWSIYSSQSQEKTMEKQLANQATQIAKQDIQIALNADQNRLLSEQATVTAKKANIEDQLRTPRPTDRTDFAPTATALAIQSTQIEVTRQAIEIRQKQIEATQTAVARPRPASAPTASDVSLGVWEYKKSRPLMPSPASPGQAIMAHGDIDASGTCHFKVFGPGEIVQGLGEGTFKLWLISGSPEYIQAAIDNHQRGAAAHAGGLCPELP